MSSAEVVPSARAAIVSAAIASITRRGVVRTTVREVAEAAGVSPPLVIHHFESKAGLVAACDEHVRRVVEGAIAAMATDGWDAGIQALLAVPDVSEAIDYLGRSLADGGEVGRWWFDQLLDLAADANRRLVAAGAVRRLDDEEMGLVLMSAMELGMFVMRPLIEARLGESLTAPATLERWARAELDLLTNGYVIDGTGAPAAGSGKETQ